MDTGTIEITSELREDGWDNGENYNKVNEMMRDVDEILNRDVSKEG